MTKLGTLQTDLTKAQDVLSALQDELPQFHALLTENEQDAQRLKTERASLDAQAQARGRVGVAKEMLEQHQADLRAARAEVERLEAELRYETSLGELGDLAKSATDRRKALDKMLGEAHTALERHVKRVLTEWLGLSDDRKAFMSQAREASLFFGYSGVPGGMSDESVRREDKKAEALIQALEARGVDVTAILTPHDGQRLSIMDRYAEGIKAPERYGHFIMGALVSDLNRGQEALRAELRLRERERREAQQTTVSGL